MIEKNEIVELMVIEELKQKKQFFFETMPDSPTLLERLEKYLCIIDC